MFITDERDVVRIATDLPTPKTDAPFPFVLANEKTTQLAYAVPEGVPDQWDSADIDLLSPANGGMSIAIIEFSNTCSHSFGAPNDETIVGHPLGARGLRPYGVFEVSQSSWIRALAAMNAVHPRHDESVFANYRHLILTFHDSTFECVVSNVDVRFHLGSLETAAESMLKSARTQE